MARKPSVQLHEEELYLKGKDGRKPFVYTHDIVETGSKNFFRITYLIVTLLVASLVKDWWDSSSIKQSLHNTETAANRAATNTRATRTAVEETVQPIVEDVQEKINETVAPAVADLQDKVDKTVIPATRAARENSKQAARDAATAIRRKKREADNTPPPPIQPKKRFWN